MRYVRKYVGRSQASGDRDEPPYALRSGPSPARVTDGLTVKVSSPVSSRVPERVQTKRSGHAQAPPARSVLGTLLALVHYADRPTTWCPLIISRSHVAQAESFTLFVGQSQQKDHAYIGQLEPRGGRRNEWHRGGFQLQLSSALPHDDAACPPADRVTDFNGMCYACSFITASAHTVLPPSY